MSGIFAVPRCDELQALNNLRRPWRRRQAALAAHIGENVLREHKGLFLEPP